VEKYPVLGIGVSRVSYGGVLGECRQWVEECANAGSAAAPTRSARYIALLTVHSIMTGVFDAAFRRALNGAEIATPDGMPLVWALRSFGARGQLRVYGPDLMLALCGQAARLGHRVYLYGGRNDTLPVLCERLRERFPALQLAGAYSPPFRPLSPEEDAAAVERIVASGAQIVFVGIGVPKQELWMASHRDRLGGMVLLGVGAAFDFHAGRVRQAPAWMQRSGLEWFFRLCMEPARLWRRYVLLNPLFLAMWALQWAGILRYPKTAGPGSTLSPAS
jgi:N-acetylglucosaminyldiphosphoundecaprenol N-acetyl-beta-D-mannosaminyltransferase